MEVLDEKEQKDELYIKELNEFWDAYTFACINEIFVGIGVALGLSANEAYSIIKNRPDDLQKAEFFNKIFEKFRKLFGKYKIGKFRPVLPPAVKHYTEAQWGKINNAIDNYWKEHAHKVVEDITVKGFSLGKLTNTYRQAQIPHTDKSLIAIAQTEKLPSTFQETYSEFPSFKPRKTDFKDRFERFGEFYKNYDFINSQKKAVNKSFSNIAMYLSQTGNDIKQAVRRQITNGVNDGKGPTMIASDLYWNVQKSGYTAESARRNWARVSATELNSVFEAGILAPYEAEAVESLMDDERAVYFIRIGGTCKWCAPRRGTIARLVPADLVGDTDSLQAMGIDDPITDIAIWPGKNNVGRKQADWWICCPAHPYNAATFQRIDPKSQEYNSDLGRVVRKMPGKLEQYGIKEAKLKRPDEEIEERKPTLIGDNLVRYNNNLYQAVDRSEMSRRMDEWQQDRSLPIPVQKDTPQYRRIFEAA